MKNVDIAIVGAGIVGLALAYKISRSYPKLSLAILEKENEIAQHQTGHNSGVIHSGIYYKPGSHKAKNCVKGATEMLAFCHENNIPIKCCGKVILATEAEELPRIENLYQRGIANGVKSLELIDSDKLAEIEPHAFALKALYSPNTHIVDFKSVARVILEKCIAQGVSIHKETSFISVENEAEGARIQSSKGDFKAKLLVNCGGLWADEIARQKGEKISERIIPFRGEYYMLREQAAKKINGLIYPVPDPLFPFLGVHLTRMINGSVEAGPNAVLALSKKGYSGKIISLKDCKEMVTFPGFWKMAMRYWKVGLYEVYRSSSKMAFLKSLQRLMPSLSEQDLIKGGAGVRSQLVNSDGTLCDDFCIREEKGQFHVLNAPSPAATASLTIAEDLKDKISKRLNLD